MKEKLFLTITIFILSSVMFSGIYFPAKNSYSYVNSIETLGEERKLIELVFSTNRKELKNKIETYVFESSLRNQVLEVISIISWSLQDKILIDTQFFNTEVFFGKDGNLFPKTKSCNEYILSSEVGYNSEYIDKFIFMIVPLKQEVESSKLEIIQNRYLCKAFQESFVSFQKNNPNLKIIDLYDAFSSDTNYFEFGDTHWNSFGFNSAIVELLKVTYPEENFKILSDGEYKENNKVFERLGLIKLNIDSPKYIILPKIDKKIRLLIFHDSFFDNSYSPHAYLEDYLLIDYKRWNKNLNLNNEEFKNYDFIVFESSVDIFFESRILYIKD